MIFSRREGIRILVIVISSGILLFSFFSLLLFLMLNFQRTVKKSEIRNINTQKYQILTYNNESSSSFGVVSLKEFDDDFIYYKGDYGNHHLISNFGEKEYACKGSCICENERRATFTLTKNLVYLLASSSSLLALGIAKDHFLSHCTSSITNEKQCQGEVIGEVDDCLEVYRKNMEKYGEDEVSDFDWDKDYVEKYFCKGHCKTAPSAKAEGYDKEFDCSSLKTEGFITIPELKVMDPGFKKRVRPEARFGLIHLGTFCWENSLKSVEYNSEEYGKISTKTGICFADHFNPAAECRRVE